MRRGGAGHLGPTMAFIFILMAMKSPWEVWSKGVTGSVIWFQKITLAAVWGWASAKTDAGMPLA